MLGRVSKIIPMANVYGTLHMAKHTSVSCVKSLTHVRCVYLLFLFSRRGIGDSDEPICPRSPAYPALGPGSGCTVSLLGCGTWGSSGVNYPYGLKDGVGPRCGYFFPWQRIGQIHLFFGIS